MKPSPIDEAALRTIREAEQFAIKNYQRVIRSLVDKAKNGSLGAIEILVKDVIKPYKEAEAERQRSTPRRPSPMPLAIRLAVHHMDRVINGQQTEPLQLTQAELASLPEAEQRLLEGHSIIDVTPEAATTVASPAEATSAEAGGQPTPPELNCICIDCGCRYHSRQPAVAKRCSGCVRARDLKRLQESKAKRRAARIAARQLKAAVRDEG